MDNLRFKKLLESKLGDVKPLIDEQIIHTGGAFGAEIGVGPNPPSEFGTSIPKDCKKNFVINLINDCKKNKIKYPKNQNLIQQLYNELSGIGSGKTLEIFNKNLNDKNKFCSVAGHYIYNSEDLVQWITDEVGLSWDSIFDSLNPSLKGNNCKPTYNPQTGAV